MIQNDQQGCSFHQHAVIEFLVKEEIPTADIHQRLQCVYGDVCMGASSVRQWVKHFKDGNMSIQDQPRSGRPQTASTEPNKKRVDEIIKEDRGVTLDAIAEKLGIGHSAVQEIIGSLGYWKICARWVLRLLTEARKVQRKAITLEMRQRYRDERDDFLLSIVTGDESCFHHFDPETKRQGMEWHHLDSPTKKKPKTVPSAKKIMGTVFWDAEGCILIEFLEPGKTVNAARYVQTLLKLLLALRDKRPGRKVMLQHDSTRPHTARLTLENLRTWGGKFSPTLLTVLIWYPPITFSLVS